MAVVLGRERDSRIPIGRRPRCRWRPAIAVDAMSLLIPPDLLVEIILLLDIAVAPGHPGVVLRPGPLAFTLINTRHVSGKILGQYGTSYVLLQFMIDNVPASISPVGSVLGKEANEIFVVLF